MIRTAVLLLTLCACAAFAGYPAENKIRQLDKVPAECEPSGYTRELYLDIMEDIVRMGADWVDKRGAVLDPVSGKEWSQTSPRFAAAAAVLLHFQRMPELLPTVVRTMDYCTERLKHPAVKNSSPDFWMRELATAYYCLKPLVKPEVSEKWRANLAAVEPEKIYRQVDATRTKLDKIANWAVYSSGGEAMREALKIGGGDFLWGYGFFDVYMEPQLKHMNAYGMYRDPGDPITYDITTRLQIANALHWGYRGKLYQAYDELLRNGGLTTLLFVSPEGYVPFGGRSGEFQFREAIVAALCEYEALRYRDAGDLRMAGRFKRQARRSAAAVLPWIKKQPISHIKNDFPSDSLHGCDRYGQYSVYSLFAASVFGQAALFADDRIAETLTFAEIGGYLLSISPDFHKVFAACRGNYIEIDTNADMKYDATGLGRVLLKGVPYGLLPAMPFPANPNYRLAPGTEAPERPVAIGPANLAEMTKVIPTLTVTKETPDDVAFSLNWKYIHQSFSLTETELKITCRAENSKSFRYEIPVLHSDGKTLAEWQVSGKKATGKFKGGSVTLSANGDLTLQTKKIANRNGLYQLITADIPQGGEFQLTISR